MYLIYYIILYYINVYLSNISLYQYIILTTNTKVTENWRFLIKFCNAKEERIKKKMLDRTNTTNSNLRALCAQIKDKDEVSAPKCASVRLNGARKKCSSFDLSATNRGPEKGFDFYWLQLLPIHHSQNSVPQPSSRIARLSHCFPTPANLLFTKTTIISPALVKRNYQRNPCDLRVAHCLHVN